jgi:hypothetical protein
VQGSSIITLIGRKYLLRAVVAYTLCKSFTQSSREANIFAFSRSSTDPTARVRAVSLRMSHLGSTGKLRVKRDLENDCDMIITYDFELLANEKVNLEYENTPLHNLR